VRAPSSPPPDESSSTAASAAPLSRAALSRELSEFLIELSISLNKHAMYPDGHPSLFPAAMAVTQRAALLLDDRPSLSLGVARQQLVIEGVATEPKHPVLGDLAGRLHRHHLGAVTFTRGLRAEEVAAALKVLAVEADRTGDPLGLGPRERLTQWQHIRLHPLTYERLELVDEGREGGGLRGAQLWVGLARAALAAEGSSDKPPESVEPVVIAKALDEHAKNEAYDQVIVGYLLQIAEELRHSGSGADTLALQRRTSRLVRAMKPETLRRLVSMGGDIAQRRKFVLDATHGMAVDAVLEIVRAAADTSQQVISSGLVRMLSKLATHAEHGADPVRPQADAALRDQVTSLLTGWQLVDPNPDSYATALQSIATEARPEDESRPMPGAFAAEPRRLVETALEIGSTGPMVGRAVERALGRGDLSTILDALETAPDGGGQAGFTLWQRLTSPALVAQLVAAEPLNFAVLDRLLPRLGPAAIEPVLDALAESESRTTRRGLLDRAGRIQADIGAAVVKRLGDPRWYVQRNMLVLLDALPRVPPDFRLDPFLAHRDPRVRREAVKLQLKMSRAAEDIGGKGSGAGRDAALRAALQDKDPRTLRIALTALQEECADELVPLVIAVLEGQAPIELRTLAVRALGRAHAPQALEALLKLTDGGRTFFGRRKLPPKRPEFLAALTALASGWSSNNRALEVLARAALSDDPVIRNATEPGDPA
jgi:hypothetical protein